MNKFSTFVTTNSFSALLPLFVEEVWCLLALPIVKVAKNSKCGRANSDHAGEQGGRSLRGMGFLQSYQLYSDFVPEILALRTYHEKRGKHIECLQDNTENVLQDKRTYINPRVRSDPSHFVGVGCHERSRIFYDKN